MKFILREERRGSRYDIILADPPKFGRGPNGEVWQLFEGLPLMLDICREILSPKDAALVLTAYSIRASFYSIHELVRETMRGRGGLVDHDRKGNGDAGRGPAGGDHGRIGNAGDAGNGKMRFGREVDPAVAVEDRVFGPGGIALQDAEDRSGAGARVEAVGRRHPIIDTIEVG